MAPSILAALADLAVLEHWLAPASLDGGAAAEVAARLGQRVGPTGETLLFKAWTEAAAGRYEAARTIAAGESSWTGRHGSLRAPARSPSPTGDETTSWRVRR